MGTIYVFCLLFCNICQVVVVKTAGISQDSGIKTANVGDTVTLSCSSQNPDIIFFAWYKQSLGDKPQLVSSWMKHDPEANVSPLYEKRFQVPERSEEGTNNLKIEDLQLSDSGTYYCGILEINSLHFGEGVFLHVKTSNVRSFIRQPAMEKLGLGDSVNLSCAAYAEQCADQQSLFWFRDGSSQPAVMHPTGEHCESLFSEKLHGKNCSFKLELNSVNSSDAGTYHCALASCGQIVFGGGTKVEIVGPSTVPPLLVFCLSAALAVCIILLLILSFLMYKLKLKLINHSFVCEETCSPLRCSTAPEAVVQSHDAGSLHYAALSQKGNDEGKQPEDEAENACVYSTVMRRTD